MCTISKSKPCTPSGCHLLFLGADPSTQNAAWQEFTSCSSRLPNCPGFFPFELPHQAVISVPPAQRPMKDLVHPRNSSPAAGDFRGEAASPGRNGFPWGRFQ